MSFETYLSDLKKKLNISKVVDPVKYLEDNFPQSYYYEPLRDSPYEKENPRNARQQLQDKALMEMVHSRHGNETGGTLFVDREKQKLIGINLCAQPVDNERVEGLLTGSDSHMELKALSLAETQITRFALNQGCEKLVHLELSRNEQLRELTFEAYPQGLKTLDAYDCRVEELVIWKELPSLERLDLARNTALSIFELNASCKRLWKLDLSNNGLKELKLEHDFSSLKDIYLHDNPLELLVLKNPRAFTSLRKLHLRNTQLRQLPERMLDFPLMENLYLHGVSLEDIPVESLPEGKSADAWEKVKTLLQANRNKELFALNEAKMILIGNPFAGKTCLRRKLIDIDAPLTEINERTPGLEVESYPIALGPEETELEDAITFKLNIWDFGGQGKYREVQQLFCSRKSLYIYVDAVKGADKEKEDELEEYYVDYEYWVNMAQAYSFDQKEKKASPVLYVLNKIDIREEFIDRKTAFENFPQISGFAPVSLKSIHESKYRGKFNELKELIRSSINKISTDIFQKSYNADWMAVKAELETLRKGGTNHILKESYMEICASKGLKEQEAALWLTTLHNIGTVIHFSKDNDLKDWVILNPLWFRDAMYKVIENEKEVRRGKFEPIDFDRIWDHSLVYNEQSKEEEKRPYTKEEHHKFIALMKAYNLCYEKEDDYGDLAYYVPSLFATSFSRPIPTFWGEPVARFALVYQPFIPAGMVNKLMVLTEGNKAKFADYLVEEADIRDEVIKQKAHFVLEKGFGNFMIFGEYRCRNEFILEDQSHGIYGHVKEDWKNRKIFIDIYTPSDSKNFKAIYHYLTSVLNQVLNKLINSHYMRSLKVEEFVWQDSYWEPLNKLKDQGMDVFNQGIGSKSMSVLEKFLQKIESDELRVALELLKEGLSGKYRAETSNFSRELTALESKQELGNVPGQQIKTDLADWTKRIIDFAVRVEKEF